ncbi:hypothetical protein AAVH_19863 [Aphelenchoides avenae]|nr:hypothetical protein AAVH_19863 [Aphelenchus avenae]
MCTVHYSPDKDLCRWATCTSDKALLDCWKEAPPWLADNKRSNPAGKFVGWKRKVIVPIPFSKYHEICPKGREPRVPPELQRRRKH